MAIIKSLPSDVGNGVFNSLKALVCTILKGFVKVLPQKVGGPLEKRIAKIQQFKFNEFAKLVPFLTTLMDTYGRKKDFDRLNALAQINHDDTTYDGWQAIPPETGTDTTKRWRRLSSADAAEDEEATQGGGAGRKESSGGVAAQILEIHPAYAFRERELVKVRKHDFEKLLEVYDKEQKAFEALQASQRSRSRFKLPYNQQRQDALVKSMKAKMPLLNRIVFAFQSHGGQEPSTDLLQTLDSLEPPSGGWRLGAAGTDIIESIVLANHSIPWAQTKEDFGRYATVAGNYYDSRFYSALKKLTTLVVALGAGYAAKQVFDRRSEQSRATLAAENARRDESGFDGPVSGGSSVNETTPASGNPWMKNELYDDAFD